MENLCYILNLISHKDSLVVDRMTQIEPHAPPPLTTGLWQSEGIKIIGAALGGAIEGISESSGNLWGLIAGDKIREWRTKNLIKCLDRTALILNERGIPLSNAKYLPFGEAFKIFEDISKQDEASISDLWANLIANAIDPSKNVKIESSFRRTLDSIGRIEAIILQAVWSVQLIKIEYQNAVTDSYKENLSHNLFEEMQNIKENAREKFISIASTTKPLLEKEDDQEIRNSLVNLMALGCLFKNPDKISKYDLGDTFPRHGKDFDLSPDRVSETITSSILMAIESLHGTPPETIFNETTDIDHCLSIQLTQYGMRFMKACSR